jgi:hypothetical protein
MGHDIIVVNTDTDKIADRMYISYNFSGLADQYGWSVMHIHGETGQDILVDLRKVMERFRVNNVYPVLYDGQDVWTKEPNVLCYILTGLVRLCEQYPTHKFYSDCYGYPGTIKM